MGESSPVEVTVNTAAEPPNRGLRGWAFRLLIVATIASFSGYSLLLPLVPVWATRGGADELGAGATTSVFMLTTVLTQLAMPWVLDRGGYRWTLVAGSLLIGLPTPLMILTADLAPLIAVSAVRGVGFGMVTVAGAALAARLVPPEQVGRASGYYGLAVGLPNLVYLSTGVWLALNVGFGLVFWVATFGPVLGAVAAVGIWLAGGDRAVAAASGGRAGATAPAPRSGPRLYAALVTPLVVMLVLAVASSAVVTFLAIPLEHASGVVAAALLGYGAAMVLSRWTAGMLSDRHGRPVLLVPWTVAAALGTLLAAWAVWPAGDGWTGPGALGSALVILGTTLFGVGFGGAQNDTIVLMFHRSGRSGYGTASAAWNIGYDGGTGLGAVGLGVVIQTLGYGPAFASTGIAVAACLLAAVPLSRERV